MAPNIKIQICVGRFALNFLIQGAITPPVNKNIQEGQYPIPFKLHHELDVVMHVIQKCQKRIKCLNTMRLHDKCVVYILIKA